MKKLIFITALIVSVLVFTGCPEISGTGIKDNILTQTQTDNLEGDNVGNPLTVDSITADTDGSGDFTVGTVEDIIVTLTFNDVIIDEDTVETGIIFYNLGATADTDGALSRQAALSPAYEVEYDEYGEYSEVIFTFNIPDGSNTSSILELFVDPTVLTANDGIYQLDYDSDDVPGEAQDDDYINYIAVTGAGYAPAGNARNPRSTYPVSYLTNIDVGTEDIEYQVYSLFGPPIEVNVTQAQLDATFDVELFNPLDGTWTAVEGTRDLNETTGIYTIALASEDAGKAGERYRYVTHNGYDLQESETVNGYMRRYSTDYDQSKEFIIDHYDTVGGDLEGWSTPGSVTWTSSASTINGYQVRLTLTASGVGTEGIDISTVTADSLKLWDDTDDVYIPWETAELGDENYEIVLYLNSGYEYQGHNLRLHIGPGMIDLGDTTADTDDLRLGDYSNYYNTNGAPLGYRYDNVGQI